MHKIGAKVAAHGGWKRGVGQGQIDGLVHPPLPDQSPAVLNGNARGAGSLAGRGVFAVFPNRDVSAQFARGNDRNLAAIEIRQVADDSPPAQFLVPDLPPKIGHGTHRTPGFLLGGAGFQQLPGRAIGQFFGQILTANALQENLQVVLQPNPVVVTDGAQLGIGLAEAAVRPAKKHFAADHAHKGPVAQHVVRRLGIDTANHGRATGHEFAEIIAHRPQHPELGRRKTGIALGHGHAARADAAGDLDFALGHGIGRSVAGIAMDDDLGPGIQPAGVVGRRPFHFDQCIGKPHGTQALPRGSLDQQANRFFARSPETAADPVLAECQNFEAALTTDHRFLYFFFQHAGFDPFFILPAGNDMK